LRKQLKPKAYLKKRVIKSNEFNERAQWDLIDMRSVNTRGYQYNYILHRIDHTSGLSASASISHKTEIEVQREVTRIMCRLGVPELFQSDNGKEFANLTRTIHGEYSSFESCFLSIIH
jgi:hypothetical protein